MVWQKFSEMFEWNYQNRNRLFCGEKCIFCDDLLTTIALSHKFYHVFGVTCNQWLVSIYVRGVACHVVEPIHAMISTSQINHPQVKKRMYSIVVNFIEIRQLQGPISWQITSMNHDLAKYRTRCQIGVLVQSISVMKKHPNILHDLCEKNFFNDCKSFLKIF